MNPSRFAVGRLATVLAILVAGSVSASPRATAATSQPTRQSSKAFPTFLTAKEKMTMSTFDPAAFANPPGEFRPMQISHGFDRHMTDPANLVGEEGIDKYLQFMQGMGIGGIVANVGYKDYLQSPRQWEIWRYGMKKAADMGMVLWFYDEKAYPSGSAGGVVTRAHPEYTAMGIACYPIPATGGEELVFDLPMSCRAFESASATRVDDGALAEPLDLASHVDAWGTLRWTPPAGKWTVCYIASRRMFEGTFATAIPHGDTHMYIDVLNPDAVRAFLRVTHQQYLRNTPPEIWKQIRAVFTDEPLLIAPYVGTMPAERDGKQNVLDQPLFTDRPAAVAWTAAFPEKFRAAKGYDIRPRLRSLFTGQRHQDHRVRQDYWDVTTNLYVEAFHQQIADWCEKNGIASSGHTLAEEGVHGNLIFEGSLLAAVRPMQLPGIDILSVDPNDLANHHFLAAKGVSSIAHLTGRPLVQCEASAHNQRIAGKKVGIDLWRAQANMLYVMGVNVLTLYHNWTAVGEDGYRQYNDYAGRLALMLRGGRHVCDVAVLYPIRSAWGAFTPWNKPWGAGGMADLGNKKLIDRVKQIGDSYHDVCKTLAQRQIDFDVVDEQAIQEAAMADGAMRAGEESYRVIVLPELDALPLATLRALDKFVSVGGIVICAGSRPTVAESEANQKAFDELCPQLLGEQGKAMATTPAGLADAIRGRIETDVQLAQANDQVYYTHRQRDGRAIYFFTNNSGEAVTIRPRLRVAGPFQLYDPMTAQVANAPADLNLDLPAYGAVFLVQP